MAGWMAAGFIAGAAIPCAYMWPEFQKRLQWASSGGDGESAVWGEPLFHMVVLGIPAGLLGGLIAGAIAFTIRRMTDSRK